MRMKFRKIRHSFGIAAPSVVVRARLPRHWHILAALLLLALLFSFLWLLIQYRTVAAASDELELLRLKVRALDDERVELRSTVGTEHSLALLEHSTRQQLLLRVRELEAQNAALMEDLLLFERLIPLLGDEAIVRVENFRWLKESGNRYRYGLLLAFHPVKNTPMFKGEMQLHISYTLGEKRNLLVFPDTSNPDQRYAVEIRYFFRKEGVLDLPPGASVTQVEVKVFQGDKLKAEGFAKL